MKSFANRLHELVDGKSIKHNIIADRIGIDETKLSRIFNDENSDPKISVLQGVTKGYNLNPYKLYQLLIGETYTDRPAGSMEAENEYLQEKIIDQQKQINFLTEEFQRLNRIIENLTSLPVSQSRIEKQRERVFKTRVVQGGNDGQSHAPH